jgi:hypothetical protein
LAKNKEQAVWNKTLELWTIESFDPNTKDPMTPNTTGCHQHLESDDWW